MLQRGLKYSDFVLLSILSCFCVQGLSAKVVQGQAGGRTDIALVAQCMFLAEVAYACPAWQDWRQGDAAGARYVRSGHYKDSHLS